MCDLGGFRCFFNSEVSLYFGWAHRITHAWLCAGVYLSNHLFIHPSHWWIVCFLSSVFLSLLLGALWPCPTCLDIAKCFSIFVSHRVEQWRFPHHASQSKFIRQKGKSDEIWLVMRSSLCFSYQYSIEFSVSLSTKQFPTFFQCSGYRQGSVQRFLLDSKVTF